MKGLQVVSSVAMSTPGSGSQQAVPSTVANQQWEAQRAIFKTPEYESVQSLFWTTTRQKRPAPSPQTSGLGTPAEPDKAAMEVEADIRAETEPAPTLLQPFSLQDEAALEVTAGALGVNIQDHNAVQQWLDAPVGTNRDMFRVLRTYHEKVVRPEYYSLAAQLEAGLRNLNANIFKIRQEVSWMAADNRQAQKYAVGVQLLTTGWPQGMGPADREYMVGWFLLNTPKVVNFCYERGYVTDHNAHEIKRYLNALSTDPVTVPAGGEFYSGMTLLTFKAFELRSAVLEKYGGGTGSPLYKDDNTPVHGHHIRIAPCSPQWQRKLESPLRVLLSCINLNKDHNASSKLTILWKSLTLLAPKDGDDIQEDITAWARLFYYEENGEFQGRLEVVKELSQIMQSPPSETTTPETTMWAEQWNRIMWGAQYELDQAEAQAVAAAKSQATVSGKGLQLGKGKRHWSSVAIHTNYYEPFPFNLQLIVVDKVYFSWDEMCDKFKAQQHKVGNYSICTVQGKPPAPVVEELNTQETEQSQLPVQPTATPKVSTAAIPGTKGAAKSQSRPKGKGSR